MSIINLLELSTFPVKTKYRGSPRTIASKDDVTVSGTESIFPIFTSTLKDRIDDRMVILTSLT